MLRSMILGLATLGLVAALGACSSDSAKNDPVVEQDAAEEAAVEEDAAPEAAKEAATEAATEAAVEAATEAAVDAAVEAAIEAGPDAAEDVVLEASEAAVKKCPNEVDLANATLPCMCGKTLVEDPETASPGCTLKVVCCPSGGGTIKCE